MTKWFTLVYLVLVDVIIAGICNGGQEGTVRESSNMWQLQYKWDYQARGRVSGQYAKYSPP